MDDQVLRFVLPGSYSVTYIFFQIDFLTAESAFFGYVEFDENKSFHIIRHCVYVLYSYCHVNEPVRGWFCVRYSISPPRFEDVHVRIFISSPRFADDRVIYFFPVRGRPFAVFLLV